MNCVLNGFSQCHIVLNILHEELLLHEVDDTAGFVRPQAVLIRWLVRIKVSLTENVARSMDADAYVFISVHSGSLEGIERVVLLLTSGMGLLLGNIEKLLLNRVEGQLLDVERLIAHERVVNSLLIGRDQLIGLLVD